MPPLQNHEGNVDLVDNEGLESIDQSGRLI